MSRLIDNVIALKLLKMLVTPFDRTEAYKLGIIDAKGKVLRPASSLKTEAERDAYDYLDRLIFNVKRLINKLPGGENQVKNLTAAYFMVKEKYEGKSSYINEKQFIALVEKLDRVTLVEETIAVEKALEEARMSAAVKLQRAFEREQQKSEASRKRAQELLNPSKKEEKPIKEEGEGGAIGGLPANHTGVTVSTDQPKIGQSDITKYKKKNKGVLAVTRRAAPVNVGC